MADQVEMGNEFATLASAATEGRLVISESVAKACALECDRYAEVLIDLQFRTEELVHVDAFGKLNSARELGAKFHGLAVGGQGSGSFRDALRQHIETVRAMADMFRKADASYAATEDANTADIGRST